MSRILNAPSYSDFLMWLPKRGMCRESFNVGTKCASPTCSNELTPEQIKKGGKFCCVKCSRGRMKRWNGNMVFYKNVRQ